MGLKVSKGSIYDHVSWELGSVALAMWQGRTLSWRVCGRTKLPHNDHEKKEWSAGTSSRYSFQGPNPFISLGPCLEDVPPPSSDTGWRPSL